MTVSQKFFVLLCFYFLITQINSNCEANGPHRYTPELFLFHIDFILLYYIGKYCFLPKMISYFLICCTYTYNCIIIYG